MATEQATGMTRLTRIRLATVMLGPSLALEGLLAASVVTASAAAWQQGSQRGRRMWKLAALGALAPWLYRLSLRTKVMRLGATPEEVQQALPGDELLALRNAEEATHALTLRARPEDVWPWLAQIGTNERGGFYSHDWLERLAGGDVHSVDRILPELQHPAVGELISPGQQWRVLRVEPKQVFVFGNPDLSWAFVLRPLDAEKTRLIIRMRWRPLPTGPFGSNLLLLPHLIMQRKMQRGLRRRIERTARAAGA